MSTLSKNISAQRIAQLIATGRTLFHEGDLAALFGVTNANTVRVTLHRLARAGVLHRVQRGLYSIVPPENIDPITLGIALLHRFCYLTTESVLMREGYILQAIDAVTFVSSASLRRQIFGHRIISRRLQPRFLHNHCGLELCGGVLQATPERAIADMLHFDPWYHFDRSVNWARVASLQRAVGYPLTPHRYADSASR